jgi:mannose-6-phosphate isomerase-like protein (cupin superfamily)
MAYAGQIITHPGLGVSIQFIKTHHETNGSCWVADYSIEAGGGKELIPHMHLHSDEWFRVLKGRGRYWLNGKVRDVLPGDEIYLPAEKPHLHPWNTGTGPLVMRNFVVPVDTGADPEGLRQMEDYIEHWFHLAYRGQVRKDGIPYLLQSAVLLKSISKQLVLTKIPVFIQKLILAPLALTGKLMGYKSTIYQ